MVRRYPTGTLATVEHCDEQKRGTKFERMQGFGEVPCARKAGIVPRTFLLEIHQDALREQNGIEKHVTISISGGQSVETSERVFRIARKYLGSIDISNK